MNLYMITPFLTDNICKKLCGILSLITCIILNISETTLYLTSPSRLSLLLKSGPLFISIKDGINSLLIAISAPNN